MVNLLHANDRRGEYPASYYAATAAHLERFPIFKGQHRADVCVVGGGYTGLSAALHLAQRGYDVVLLEAHRVGFGASGRNGGQVGSGMRQDQLWVEKVAGKENAHRLWALAEEAKGLVKSLITDHAMPVSFHPGIAHACRSEREVADTHAYAEKLARDYGYHHIQPLDRAGIRRLIGSTAYVGGEIDRDAGHLHPLNYAIGLAQAAAKAGVRIFEMSEVHRVEAGAKPVVRTASGQVDCATVILAGNAYLGQLNEEVAAKVMPINNFIIATEPLGDAAKDLIAEPVAVADSKFVVNYWRLSEDNRLLFGGAESYGYRFPDIRKVVRKPLLEIYPQLAKTRIDYAWGGTVAITVNRMPCFTRPGQNILSASGYSGHGVAMATLAGRLLAEAAAAENERFDLMASLPQHRFPGGVMLRWPLLVAAMTWFSLRDRLGI